MTKQTILETLMANGGIALPVAERVFSHYRKLRVIKFSAHDGYQIAHGGFFDRDVILRAVLATAPEFPRGSLAARQYGKL